jgi:poly-gamma-glutamate capsule biosynthesis protein CapA/YwtB (metallophosphatase superfamily)
MGKVLLRDPTHDPFAPFAALFATADLRFVNLEGPLSEQHGETMSPVNPLIFTGPPVGADALARGHVTFVSTANNHAWDYGKRGLFATIDNLDRVGVAHAGTGRTRDDARRAVVVEKNGVRLAILAVTDVFNFGPLAGHEADEHLARADPVALAESIASLWSRGDVDLVVVSYHGGDEYNDAPLARARSVLHAVVDAGADAVLGHHPHVIQAMEWYRGRPILYSMGNMLMQMHRDHPWTGYGYLARLTFAPGAPVKLEACPFRIVGLEARPFVGDPQRAAYEGVFFAHLREVSSHVAPLVVGPPGPDGCAVVEGPR